MACDLCLLTHISGFPDSKKRKVNREHDRFFSANYLMQNIPWGRNRPGSADYGQKSIILEALSQWQKRIFGKAIPITPTRQTHQCESGMAEPDQNAKTLARCIQKVFPRTTCSYISVARSHSHFLFNEKLATDFGNAKPKNRKKTTDRKQPAA